MLRITTARARASLLASSALLVLPIAAHAQDDTKVNRDQVVLEAQSGVPVHIVPDPQIVIANPNTPTTARDPNNLTGVGQMVTDVGGGFIGLCTGTLINPRTVIFAAHCVNDEAATAYGAASGGTPIGFGFSNTNLAGLQAWYFAGAGQHQTNIANAFYNSNYVFYNPASLEPNAAGFLYADVATASLDTPAANIPTWAMLFSALPDRPITAASGAGYHVTIDGYGNNGTATTGSTGGIDFRRRLAENFIGGLASLDQFENFLFGGAANANPQNLYWIDFDDPRRGATSAPFASPFDFNAWRDNAVPPNASGNSQEGITASGDSGGPLILDQVFATKLILGVLSGGYTRFFNGQPANGYGTAAFYQPLYLYWDFVAANNPYHYVGALAGNGDWTDPTHWVSTLDPNYYILDSNGNPINGVPTDPGAGPTGNTGTWGQACFQSGGVSDCLDVKTGIEMVEVKPIGTGASEGKAIVSADTLTAAGNGSDDAAGTVTAQQSIERVAATPQTLGPQALPVATLANGLPGASGFVPNNFDGNRLTATAPRYFDVTLGAAGTTSLGTAMTIDRFKVANANATLDIRAGGSLTSLIDVNQLTGIVQANGTLTSVGDYFFMSGLLSGTGRVNAPFLTSVLGNFAPGTLGTIGTLTIGGNLVMSSGSTLAIDIGANGTSDRLAVVAGSGNTGAANLGGRVLFSLVSGQTIHAGDAYTILTAAGGRTGTFLAPSSLSAILTPQLSYTANSALATIVAGLYSNVVANTPVQTAYAALLDRNRNNSPLTELYTVLDLANAATIQSTFESWAPRSETLVHSVGPVALDNMDRFYRSRLSSLDPGETLDGSLTVIGSPLDVVASRIGAQVQPGMQGLANGEETEVQPGRLPLGMRGYVAGGYLSGQSDSMATAVPFGGDDDFDGWFVAAGIESDVEAGAVFGLGISYTMIDGTTGGVAQGVEGEMIQGTLYAKADVGGLVFDAHASVGLLNAKTERTAALGGTNYTLRSHDGAFAYSSEIGLAKMFGDTLEYGPRVVLRAGSIEFSPTVEGGGPMALRYDRGDYTSVQGLAGLVLGGETGQVRPFASAYYVHEFEDQATGVGANFVNGVGPNALFGLNGTDDDWGELSAGLSFGGEDLEFSVSADTTVFRGDVSNQSYKGSVTMRF